MIDGWLKEAEFAVSNHRVVIIQRNTQKYSSDSSANPRHPGVHVAVFVPGDYNKTGVKTQLTNTCLRRCLELVFLSGLLIHF